jgi:hypothetical protein
MHSSLALAVLRIDEALLLFRSLNARQIADRGPVLSSELAAILEQSAPDGERTAQETHMLESSRELAETGATAAYPGMAVKNLAFGLALAVAKRRGYVIARMADGSVRVNSTR